jgi:hypothetical protein
MNLFVCSLTPIDFGHNMTDTRQRRYLGLGGEMTRQEGWASAWWERNGQDSPPLCAQSALNVNKD